MVFYIIAATLHEDQPDAKMEERVEHVLRNKVLGTNPDARRNNGELYTLEVNHTLKPLWAPINNFIGFHHLDR